MDKLHEAVWLCGGTEIQTGGKLRLRLRDAQWGLWTWMHSSAVRVRLHLEIVNNGISASNHV